MKPLILSVVALLFTSLSFGQTKVEKQGKDADLLEYIEKETIGGKLDFKMGLEDNKMYVYNGIGYNKKDFSILLWGQAIKRLGIPSLKKVTKLWEEINKRSLTGPEKRALIRGFEEDMK